MSRPQAGHQPQLAVAKYNLSDSETEALIEKLFDEKPPTIKSRFICYDFAGNDKFSNLGRTIEARVFLDTFGNTLETLREEYGGYEHASSFFVIIDQKRRKPVGVMRVIYNSHVGLKALNDIYKPLNITVDQFMKHYGIKDLDTVSEVSTLAILPEYRHRSIKSAKLSLLFHRAYFRKSQNDGIDHAVAIIDKRAKRGIDIMGIPFKVIMGRGSFEYIESQSSYAIYGYIPEFTDKLQEHSRNLRKKRRLKPILHARLVRKFATGKGYDHKLQF